MGLQEAAHPTPSIERAVWENYYKSQPFEDNLRDITRAVAATTRTGFGYIEQVVRHAVLEAPEIYDSLQVGAAKAIAGLLEDGVPTYLWTIGVKEIQDRKVHVIRTAVQKELAGKYGDEHATRIVSLSLRNTLSSESKATEFAEIAETLRANGRLHVYVADDRQENIDGARIIAERHGLVMADFRINRNHPDGTFTACVRHLQEWKNRVSDPKAVIFDVDDTAFNETGPGGRISKIPGVIMRGLQNASPSLYQ